MLAKYVRAVDHADGQTMGDLFAASGKVEVFYNNGGIWDLLFMLSGKEAIAMLYLVGCNYNQKGAGAIIQHMI
jgi:hypothetical protein